MALSAAAQRALAEPRLRRLIEIETEDIAVLAPGMVGPLGDHVAYVWIDQPPEAPPLRPRPAPPAAGAAPAPAPVPGAKIVVEVRAGDHPVERREIAVRGLAPDVAARLVAIAVSELTRAGIAPRPAPPPEPTTPAPTPEEQERAARNASALLITPTAAFVGLPASRGVLGGVGVSLGFRTFGAGESLFARWTSGSAGGAEVRWLELGVAADYRIWMTSSLRLALGGQAALGAVHISDAGSIASEVGQRDTWSARAGGLVALEARVAPAIWLALDLEPGAVLRAVRFTDIGGGPHAIEGVWLGGGLSVRFERVHEAGL